MKLTIKSENALNAEAIEKRLDCMTELQDRYPLATIEIVMLERPAHVELARLEHHTPAKADGFRISEHPLLQWITTAIAIAALILSLLEIIK